MYMKRTLVRRTRNGFSGLGRMMDDYGDPTTTTTATPTTTTTKTTSGGDLSFWDKLGTAVGSALGTRQQPQMPIIAPQSGMSTTTMVALAGGAVLVAVLLARR